MERMKILWLTHKGVGYVGAPQTQYEFEQTVAKHADCAWAGEEWPLHRQKESMDETVQRVMPAADWVIDMDNNLHNPKPRNRSYRIGLFLTDLHGKHYYGVKNPARLAKMVNDAGYDAVFMRYLDVYGCEYEPDVVYKTIKCDKFWIPWSVDIEKFTPKRPYSHDVSFIGMTGRAYPMRQIMWEALPKITAGYKMLRRRSPVGETYKRKCSMLRSSHIVGGDYAEALGRSRILLFGSSIYRYPLQKFFESTASGCLAMSDEPCGAQALGFIDGETYMRVDANSWESKIRYYLKKQKEAEAIAQNGLEMTRIKHSHDVRARQFIEMLKK